MASNNVEASVPSAATKLPPADVKISIKDKLNHMTPKISARATGLRILFEPKEVDEVDIDVVAVHGIAVNPEHTWAYRDTARDIKVNWLSHPTMLPAALPKARIMAFGYESYWFGENAIKQSVSSVAGQMLKALDAKRSKCPARPILFIGHCFGGLVIQELFNLTNSHYEDHPRVASCIAGVVFLGTPHYGIQNSTAFSTQGNIYQRVAQAEVPIVDNVLHTMAHDNELLVRIVSSFTRKIATQGEKGPKIYCFYEQKPTKVGLIAGLKNEPSEFVLNESSASLSGHEKEALALDHFGMNKFETPDDSSYEAVVNQIVKMAEHAQRMTSSPLMGKTNPRYELDSNKMGGRHRKLAYPAQSPRWFETTREVYEMGP